MNYDKTKVYEQEIEPLLAQIHGICEENGIPYIADFLVKIGEQTADYKGAYGDVDNELRPNIIGAMILMAQADSATAAVMVRMIDKIQRESDEFDRTVATENASG